VIDAAYDEMFQLEKVHWWFCARRRLLERLIGRRLAKAVGLQILDCGCGTGANLIMLKAFGDARGVDFNDQAVQYCRDNGLDGKVEIGDVHDLSAHAGTVDLVTLLDVLYHQAIKDDVAVLKQVHSALKPGGHVLITDSAFEFLRSSHDVAVQTRERYTRGKLRGRLQEAGFDVQYAGYFFLTTFPLVLAVRIWKKMLPPGEVESDVGPVPAPINAVLLALLKIEAALAAAVPLPLGSSVVMLAKKR
jgi:SAM-dependent methyltransferase